MPTAPRKKRVPGRAPRRMRPRQTAPRKPPRADLLIIECDSGKLAADQLNLGSVLERLAGTNLARAVLANRRIAFVKTTTEEKLKQDLADTLQKHGRFRSVLVVGHSNEAGLVLTGDGLRDWRTVGNWLRIFEPEFVFLVACEAGRSKALREIFDPMRKSLRQVFASPVALHRNQAPPLIVLILMLLIYGRIDEDQSGALRLANYALTGGQLFRWKRRETGPGEEVRAALWDGVASLFDYGSWNLVELLHCLSRNGAG
jgi:hypothetical protein